MEKQYKIYIKFSTPKGHPFPLVSWLIRLFEWSDVSHVFIDLPLENKIFHAYFNNIRYENRKDYLKKVNIKHSFPVYVNEPVYKSIQSHFKRLESKRKGYYLQLMGALFSLGIRNIFKLNYENPFKKWYTSKTCSEIISEISNEYLNHEYIPFEEIDSDNLLVKDVKEYCYIFKEKFL